MTRLRAASSSGLPSYVLLASVVVFLRGSPGLALVTLVCAFVGSSARRPPPLAPRPSGAAATAAVLRLFAGAAAGREQKAHGVGTRRESATRVTRDEWRAR